MSTRFIFFTGFLIICLVLGTSIYLEYFEGFIPCALCTLQRVAFAAMGVMFLLGTFFYRQRFIVILASFLSIIFSIAGFTLAARQTWLQHFPPLENTECGVSLQYMLSALPLQELIGKIFTGSAECTQRSWEFLSFSMAEWAVILFAILFCMGSIIFIRETKRKSGSYR